MSNAKHTLGPWGVIIGDAGPIVFSGNKGGMVATCLRQITSAEREANARLIAAAPELLAAAQKALDQCCDLVETDAGHALASAIAKAKGE